MKLSLITPKKTLFDKVETSEVSLPSFKGVLTVRKNHAPLLTTLSIGFISFLDESQVNHKVFVSCGYAEVGIGTIKIFADVAEHTTDINKEESQASETETLEKLASRALNPNEIEQAQQKLNEARTRLKA